MLLIATDSASHLSLATYRVVNAVLPAITPAAAQQWAQTAPRRLSIRHRPARIGPTR